MNKKQLLLLAGWAMLLFSGSGAHAEPERDLSGRWPSATEEGAYHVRRVDNGRILWDVNWTAAVYEQAGRTGVRINEKGYGQPWGYGGPIRWEKQMGLLLKPDLRMEGLKGSRWNEAGEPLSELEITVHPDQEKILYRDTGKKGGEKWRKLNWRRNIFADEFLFHWVRTLNFHQEPAGEMLLLVSPKRWLRVQAHVRGKEEVETPAGTFLCYRVELSYKNKLVSLFAPDMTLWCAVDPPHFWVRYEGSIGGPGSPRAVIELLRYRQRAS